MQVIGGVIADDIDDGRGGPARIVQIGQAVGQPGPEMKQRGGRLAGDPPVAIRGARRNAFKQAQDRADAAHRIQRRDEMHLRCPRIGKTQLHAAINQSLHDGLGTIHFTSSR